MALEQGADFGTGIAFTCGPLGMLGLSSAQLWFSDLAVVAFAFQSFLYCALCVSLVYALRESVGLIGAVVLAFLAMALVGRVEWALVVIAIWSFVLLTDREQRPRFAYWGFIVGGATLAAVEMLVKLSVGPVIAAVCVVTLIAARARIRDIGAFAGLFALEVAALWLIAGQDLNAIGDYLANGREIVSGYSEAMGLDNAPRWQTVVAVLTVPLITVGACFPEGERRHRIGRAVVALIIGFAVYKQDIVRLADDHMEVFFSTAMLLWLAIPWRDRGQVALLAGGVAFATLVLGTATVTEFRPNAVANARTAISEARTALAPAQRAEMVASTRAFMREAYQLDARILEQIGRRSVAIEPWEVGVAWAYDLEWAPFPTMQNYVAYTRALDELGAAAAASESGPELILRHELTGSVPAQYPGRAIDGRFPGWEGPSRNARRPLQLRASADHTALAAARTGCRALWRPA